MSALVSHRRQWLWLGGNFYAPFPLRFDCKLRRRSKRGEEKSAYICINLVYSLSSTRNWMTKVSYFVNSASGIFAGICCSLASSPVARQGNCKFLSWSIIGAWAVLSVNCALVVSKCGVGDLLLQSRYESLSFFSFLLF